MNRPFIINLIFAGTLSLQAQMGPLEQGEASEAARGAAMAAIRGPERPFLEALDVDRLLEGRVEAGAWGRLTERQREILRSAVRQRFLGMLAPGSLAASEVAWSAALPPSSDGVVDVMLGLRLSGKTLKTRWRMQRSGARWRIRDVILSDPGISLAQATLATFGSQPLVTRRGLSQARAEILPPLAALLVIALVVALAAPRLPPPRRKFLCLAAAAPAIVFLTLGLLGAARAIWQPTLLRMPAAAEPWRLSEKLALRAEREGRAEEARSLWERALAAGAPGGPVAYERGLAARQRGDVAGARAFFESALSANPPAPGAAKELAALDAGQGRLPVAERQIAHYLAAAGPDPEALALAAVIATDLGKSAEAVAAIAEARRLSADGSHGAELEAQIRARAGDAGGAVAALRPLAGEGRVDRAALRADPAYMTIATDPAWVAFINESTVNSQQSTGKTR